MRSANIKVGGRVRLTTRAIHAPCHRNEQWLRDQLQRAEAVVEAAKMYRQAQDARLWDALVEPEKVEENKQALQLCKDLRVVLDKTLAAWEEGRHDG